MKDDNLDTILENLMNEGAEDLFRAKLDPINVYVTGAEKWAKYSEAFGDMEFDDMETADFTVLWDADFDYKSDGIYGVDSTIERVYGTIDFIMYDRGEDDSQGSSLEFTKEDFDGMTLVNEPKFSEHGQLVINGVEINFARNTVTIEYL